jgi:hypothetical protein
VGADVERGRFDGNLQSGAESRLRDQFAALATTQAVSSAIDAEEASRSRKTFRVGERIIAESESRAPELLERLPLLKQELTTVHRWFRPWNRSIGKRAGPGAHDWSLLPRNVFRRRIVGVVADAPGAG